MGLVDTFGFFCLGVRGRYGGIFGGMVGFFWVKEFYGDDGLWFGGIYMGRYFRVMILSVFLR